MCDVRGGVWVRRGSGSPPARGWAASGSARPPRPRARPPVGNQTLDWIHPSPSILLRPWATGVWYGGRYAASELEISAGTNIFYWIRYQPHISARNKIKKHMGWSFLYLLEFSKTENSTTRKNLAEIHQFLSKTVFKGDAHFQSVICAYISFGPNLISKCFQEVFFIEIFLGMEDLFITRKRVFCSPHEFLIFNLHSISFSD